MSKMATVQGKQVNITGWRPDRPDHRDRKLPRHTEDGALPPSADLRPTCPDVVDQGQLGSCTANGSTSAMEFLYKKAGQENPLLSRLYLYYVTRVRVEGTPATEDSGCMIRDVMKALASIGTCKDATWPYDISKFSDSPPPAADAEAAENEILQYLACTDLNAVKQSLADGYPVVIGFSVPENMMSDACAQTGIVQYPGPQEQIIGGHCVLAVGYDDAKQLITFENSWGTGWGDQGFGYLSYKFYADTGNGPLADDCWTIRTEEMPTPPAPPEPTPPDPTPPIPPDPDPTPPDPTPQPPDPPSPDPKQVRIQAAQTLLALTSQDSGLEADLMSFALNVYIRSLS